MNELRGAGRTPRLGAEGERAHIAREIHDELGQALTAAQDGLSLFDPEVRRSDAPDQGNRLQD